jgi:hypothetical protein
MELMQDVEFSMRKILPAPASIKQPTPPIQPLQEKPTTNGSAIPDRRRGTYLQPQPDSLAE